MALEVRGGTIANITLSSEPSLSNGLLLHWPMDGGRVLYSTVNDLSGNSRNGTRAATSFGTSTVASAPKVASTTVFITDITATRWVVPDDFSNANIIEAIGGGGAGDTNTGNTGNAGGGGGGYSKALNVSVAILPAGSTTMLQIGTGGDTDGENGTDTFLGGSYSTSTCSSELTQAVCARRGTGGTSVTANGVGGSSLQGIGDVRFSGGNGGDGNAIDNGGGGGGAAGPFGVGKNGGTAANTTEDAGAGGGGNGSGRVGAANPGTDGGVGGVNYRGTGAGTAGTGNGAGGNGSNGGGGGGGDVAAAGGNGGAGNEWTSSSGATAGSGGGGGGCGAGTTNPEDGGDAGLYGGGGGGCETNSGDMSGNGAQGMIAVTYWPAPRYVSGRIGQALEFNAQGNAVTGGDVDGGSFNAKAISFWVKAATTTATQGLMQVDVSDGTRIVTSSTGAVTATGFNNATVYVDGSTSLTTINDLNWHHIVIATSTGANVDDFWVGSTTASSFGGQIDDVRIYSRTLSAKDVDALYKLGGTTKINTTIKTQPNLMNGLVGWWTFDGKDMSIRASSNQVTDRSGQDNPGSITGMGSGTTTVAGIIGQALYFDGIDDLVTVADATELDLGSSDVTVSFWAKTASTTSDRMIVMNKRTDGNDKEFEFAIRSTNRDLVYECENAGGGGSATSEDNVWDINTWFHGVIVVDRATFTPTFYVNGKAVTLESNTVNSCDTPSNAIVRIGARTSTTNLLDARLDDVRLYNRKLSMAEVTQLYQLGGTTKLNTTIISNQGLNTGLAGHWTFDGKDIDFSTSNVTSEVRDRSSNGIHLDMRDHASTTAPGRIGQSIPFDGNVFMQYDTSNGDALDLDSAYTISMWMKRSETVGGTAQTVIRRGANSGTDSLSQYEIALDETSGAITVRHGDGSTSQDISIGNITEADGWTHLACVKESAQLTCYKNGALFSGPTAITIGSYTGTESTFLIGSVLQTGNSKYGGKLDDIRVYNRALGVDEIKRLYDLGK